MTTIFHTFKPRNKKKSIQGYLLNATKYTYIYISKAI